MLFPMFSKDPKQEKLDELKSMNKRERKEFLSNDLIARMIRLEQRVSASFGEVIPYTKTKYYQNLTAEEKKNFEKYLKTKLGSKFVFGILASFLAAGFFMSGSLTGNVVGANNSVSYGGMVVAGLAVVGLIIFLIYHIHKRRQENMFKSVLNLFDNSIKRKIR
ncbi:Uncharacterised protein [uncultured archaeon]|nr:Uncharacterised protein [uncultured archaeon]